MNSPCTARVSAKHNLDSGKCLFSALGNIPTISLRKEDHDCVNTAYHSTARKSCRHFDNIR